MPDRPLVSVITAVYNCEAFLPEAIAGVLAQSYPHWEYIVVNDGSTDNTAAIACEVAEANSQILYLEHQGIANRGACSSRNLALQYARGEYIAILDADDVWLPNKLAEQVALAQQFPGAGLIHGVSEYWLDWSGRPQDAGRNYLPPVSPGERLYDPPELLRIAYPLGRCGAPCPSSLLIATHLLRSVGGFEEAFDRHQSFEDQALLAKLYLAAPVYISSRCWDRYRIHPNSCCSVAEHSGALADDRRVYFEWLREYLIGRKVVDEAIWKAWRRESLCYRHPILHLLKRVARRMRQSLGLA